MWWLLIWLWWCFRCFVWFLVGFGFSHFAWVGCVGVLSACGCGVELVWLCWLFGDGFGYFCWLGVLLLCGVFCSCVDGGRFLVVGVWLVAFVFVCLLVYLSL